MTCRTVDELVGVRHALVVLFTCFMSFIVSRLHPNVLTNCACYKRFVVSTTSTDFTSRIYFGTYFRVSRPGVGRRAAKNVRL